MVSMTHGQDMRAGQYVRQPTGCRAFIPRPTPAVSELRIEGELLQLLSRADQALGRLDASADVLPNPDLFVAMYVGKEAVLSSQIEGTRASLTDLLEHEALRVRKGWQSDVGEVVNYVRAMHYGLERLRTLPISNRLLREIHKELLKGVRGGEKSPGDFRTSQNWIGPSGSDLSTAAFVPPPPFEMQQAMGELEDYIHRDTTMPILIKAGLIHSQFETIHPFLDGNGRMGRLLITFFLCQQGVLKRPLLYLSLYFKENRDEYYNRLQSVREAGEWEHWLRFFLTAVLYVSGEAAETARQIIKMREQHRKMIQEKVIRSVKGLELLDLLYQEPFMTVSRAMGRLNVSYPTANSLIANFARLELLKEITGRKRNRVFVYGQYVVLLEKGITQGGRGNQP
ncbi:MAG: Fic family protein [Chloroflexi bacterium]|nr:Fic family protein [Chloroflexota bacterium]